MPELVVYSEHGQPETLAYQTLTTLRLNELQNEHKELQQARELIQAQGEQLAELKAQTAGTQTMKVQFAELQRLTTQLTVFGDNRCIRWAVLSSYWPSVVLHGRSAGPAPTIRRHGAVAVQALRVR